MAERTLGLIWDVTDMLEKERLIAERETRALVTLDCIGDGVVTTDAHGNTVFINREAERLTGWTRDIAAGKPVSDILQLVDETDGRKIEHAAIRCLLKHEAIGISSHVQLVTRDGRRIAVEDSAAPIWHDGSTLLGAVVVFRDVTHQRLLAAEVSWHATHDVLTELFNRREFERQVAAALHASKQSFAEHTVLYIDLDRFKLVNDTAGHAAGDALLKVLAGMLQHKMRDSDLLARLGGDELGLLLRHCDLERARPIAEEIRQLVKDFRFVWDDNSFELGASIGLVGINVDSRSVSDILSAADEACYVAKEEGRNRIHVYAESDSLMLQRHTETAWVPRLNEALRLNHFRLFVMPIVGLNGDQPPHEEVLLRLTNGQDTLILPGAFIPAAERYHIMPLIDRWVLQAACNYLGSRRRAAQAAGRAQQPRRLSINLSGLSMNDDQLIGFITSQLAAYDVDPAHLCLEITETAAIGNLPKAKALMNSLKALGCSFSLDDFGSGLSSFAYLKSLPVDYIKIDGAFIRDIAINPIHLAMVEAIHKVGQVMGIRTVAEYVQDDESLTVLRALGVNFAQGHAVGVPTELIYPDVE